MLKLVRITSAHYLCASCSADTQACLSHSPDGRCTMPVQPGLGDVLRGSKGLPQGERHNSFGSNDKALAISFLWGIFNLCCRLVPGLHLDLIREVSSSFRCLLNTVSWSFFTEQSHFLTTPTIIHQEFLKCREELLSLHMLFPYGVCLGFLKFFSKAGKEQSNYINSKLS